MLIGVPDQEFSGFMEQKRRLESCEKISRDTRERGANNTDKPLPSLVDPSVLSAAAPA
jgi:hypothetical protein